MFINLFYLSVVMDHEGVAHNHEEVRAAFLELRRQNREGETQAGKVASVE